MKHRRTVGLAVTITGALALSSSALAAGGSQLFSQAACGSCHTLAAAHAAGTSGPNLDMLQPSSGAVAGQVTYGGDGMPSYGGRLSSAQIDTLAAWVATVAGHSATTVTAPAGMTKAKVRAIQAKLASIGYLHHSVTGTWGPSTVAAIKSLQHAAGITVDGLWGPKTAAALASRLK
ncbi:MAG: peptidoglycan-binding protein [Actinomycetes bacterium]